MARRALVVCAGLRAAAQIGAPREYYVGEGADRVNFEVGWADDVRAAVARACGEVYAGRTRQECVDLMVDRVEQDRTLTIDIVVDGAGLRSVDVAPSDDPRERAAVACDGLEHTGWDDCTRSFVKRVAQNRGGREGFAMPLWNDLVAADPKKMTCVAAPTFCTSFVISLRRRFVQVGANCGTYECAVCGDPIFFDQKKFQWRGVVVEPNPATFALLAQNYANASDRVSPVNVAVCGEDGPATLYVDAAHPTAETASIHRPEADPSAFARVDVTCLSLESLWRRHVAPWLSDRVDILQLDTEKLEHAIILATNFSKLAPRPDHVLYESVHLSDAEYLEVREHLRRHGYSSFWKWPGCGEAEHDTLASHVDARRGEHRLRGGG